MAKAYRFMLIIGLLVLVAAGLNTSNQGMNRLTMESRPAAIGADAGKGYLTITALGQPYFWTKGKVLLGMNNMVYTIKPYVSDAEDYVLRIWRIFWVLAFY